MRRITFPTKKRGKHKGGKKKCHYKGHVPYSKETLKKLIYPKERNRKRNDP